MGIFYFGTGIRLWIGIKLSGGKMKVLVNKRRDVEKDDTQVKENRRSRYLWFNVRQASHVKIKELRR